MAEAIYGGPSPARKGIAPPLLTPLDPSHALPTAGPLFTTVGTAGGTSPGAVAEAIPGCDRPISAVFAMTDAGFLALVTEAAFDATCTVTRVLPPRR